MHVTQSADRALLERSMELGSHELAVIETKRLTIRSSRAPESTERAA